MRAKIEIRGAKSTRRMLDNLKREARSNVQGAIKKAGFMVESEVKKSVAGRGPEPQSVDTGRFLNSVKTEHSGWQSTVFTELEYPKYLEFGTSRIQERRHFRNSADRKKSAVVSLIEGAVEDATK